MKPAFALDLDHDSVTLLQRSGEGWLTVKRVDLTQDEVEDALMSLKARAEALAPDEGLTTKLILPPSQILYTEVEAPGPDRATRRMAIGAALKGRTPYAISDLVFDFTAKGDRAKVAAVAKVTLDEAEDFAERFGFRPVCFVAVPPDSTYAGEPFFGLTARAGDHMPDGARLDRDQDPVRVSGALAVADAEAAPEAGAIPEPDAVNEAVATTEEPAVDVVAPEPATADAPLAALPDETGPAAEVATVEDTAEVAAEEASADDAAPEEVTTGAEAPPPPAAEAPAKPFEGMVAAMNVRHETGQPHASEVAEQFDEAPFIAIEDAEDAAEPGVVTAGLPGDADAGAPPPFQTRRAAPLAAEEDELLSAGNRLHLTATDPVAISAATLIGEGVAAITSPGLDIPLPGSGADAEDGSRAPKRRAGALGRPVLSSIPDGVHGTLAQQNWRRPETDLAAAETPVLKAPARPAAERVRRAQAAASPQVAASTSGRGRVLLGLSGVLVALMLAIGVGSAWFSGGEDPAPEQTGATAGTNEAGPAEDAVSPADVAVAEPDPALPTLADPAIAPAEPVDPTANATEAAIADALAEPEVAQPAAVAATPPAASPEPQADATAAPALSPATPQPQEAEAPVALPDAGAVGADAPPLPQAVPPPFGTVVAFDAQGLIVPTPEGVVTPDGFTLFAGRPPVTPPVRPGTVVPPAPAPAAQPAAEPAPDTAAPPDDGAALGPETLPPADPAFAGKRPRARPESIVAAAAAARQKAEALAEAAAAAAKAEAERLASATPLAVSTSRRPVPRPSGLFVRAVETAAVEAAVAAAVAESVTVPEIAPAAAAPAPVPVPVPQPKAAPAPEPETVAAEEIDEPEPVAAAPNIPTTATVSKQATIKNAINLGEISLIGVYGSSANRRALVRMPSGRFVKIKVGDRLDGGTVAAIGESEVTYVKRGQSIVLKMTKKG